MTNSQLYIHMYTPTRLYYSIFALGSTHHLPLGNLNIVPPVTPIEDAENQHWLLVKANMSCLVRKSIYFDAI